MNFEIGSAEELRINDNKPRQNSASGDSAWMREFEKMQQKDWQCKCWENNHNIKRQSGLTSDSPLPQRLNSQAVVTPVSFHTSQVHSVFAGNNATDASAALPQLGTNIRTITQTASTTSSFAVLNQLVDGNSVENSLPASGEGSGAPFPQWNKNSVHTSQTSAGVHVYMRDIEFDALNDGKTLLQRLRKELRHSGYAIAALTVNGKTFK